MTRIQFLLLASIFLLFSCGNKVKSKEQLKAEFKVISDNLASDTVAANQFIINAKTFINQANEDTNKVHFQKLIAETYTMMGHYDKAIEEWDVLRNTYVRHSLSAEALFKKAFLISEMKGLKDASRPLYEEFLIKYPNHRLAEAASFQISNLDVNNEELLLKILSDTTSERK